jgi:phage shock protein PspC (stress-responsive transcriptional regulator)
VNQIHATFAAQGLVRPRDGRVLAGVVAGLGRRFGIDPWPARLLFVLLLLVIPGSQLLIYPVLWILMPAEGSAVAAVPGVPVPAGPAPGGPMPPAPPVA